MNKEKKSHAKKIPRKFGKKLAKFFGSPGNSSRQKITNFSQKKRPNFSR